MVTDPDQLALEEATTRPPEAKPDSTPARGIQVTDRALARIRVAMEKDAVSPEVGGLRLGVTGCGCSGLTYDVCFDSHPHERDGYFTFFGLPRKLNLDDAALEREFYALSRKLHPDLYARSSSDEQSWSLEKTSQLNDAYRTLRDPIARTQYLLQLEGVQLEEQSKAATDRARQTGEEKKQVVPPEMLEEVFDLNMQLQELRMGKQMGERDEDVVRSLEQASRNFQQRLDSITDELKQYWNEWDALVDAHSRELPPH